MIFVPGLPIAQGSKNAYKRGTKIVLVETAKGLKEWRATVAEYAAILEYDVLDEEAITITLMFMLPAPKKTKRRYPTTKPDIDKLSRAILDALTGVWYKDDSQVVKLEAEKVYTYGEPGVYITRSHLHNNLVTPIGAREQMATRRID